GTHHRPEDFLHADSPKAWGLTSDRAAIGRADDRNTAFRRRCPLYRKTTLENGIQVVTEAVPGVRSVSLGVVVNASPHDEAPGQSGLAHLTEHALFQGTSSRDALQIARFMDMAGGNLGAFTARDYTCFYATVLDDYGTYALDLLGDLLLNSTFPEERVENEKQAIL